MSIWVYLKCDICGKPGTAIKGRPRATLVRKQAREKGWSRPEIDGIVRDICLDCAMTDPTACLPITDSLESS